VNRKFANTRKTRNLQLLDSHKTGPTVLHVIFWM